MGGKLAVITNRKSHMSFPLVPKSVTLNDLERHNRPNGCLISPNSVAFWADYVKVVEDTSVFSAAKCRPKNVGFNDISLRPYYQGITFTESVEVRHSSLASENLTNNQP